MTVLIRPIEYEDIGDAVNVIIGGSTRPESEHPDDIEAYWAAVTETRAQRGDVLVAVDDRDVVGVCQVLIFQHFQHAGGWCCEIESVHVRANRRSQGIGGALLDTAEAFARDRGCYRIQLTSNSVRTDAHRFYVAHGYSATHQGFKKFFSS